MNYFRELEIAIGRDFLRSTYLNRKVGGTNSRGDELKNGSVLF